MSELGRNNKDFDVISTVLAIINTFGFVAIALYIGFFGSIFLSIIVIGVVHRNIKSGFLKSSFRGLYLGIRFLFSRTELDEVQAKWCLC